ncbi:MAG: hypothetical protein C0404_02415 [Verrucomicrobia bacterium]|nr:hypothetical protein [Verrucomicrobiota bacterium]
MNLLEQTSDDELLRRYVGQNDRDALGVLFRRHADAAYSTALRVCRNAADAEDAVQGAFIKVMQTAGSFRGGGEQGVRFWIMKIVVGTCKNTIRSHISRRKREEFVMEDEDDIVVPDEAAGAEDDLRERSAEVLRTLDGMPEQFRTAIWLRHYLGMALKDAAEAAGVPERTLESRVYRGMRMLRDKLAECGVATSVSSLGIAIGALPVETAPASLLGGLSGESAALAGGGVVAGKTVASGSGILKVAAILAAMTLVGGGVYVVSEMEKAAPPAAPRAVQTQPTGDVVYVDGPVIFKDEFENGLKSWEVTSVSVAQEAGSVMMGDDENRRQAERNVSIESVDFNGKRLKALRVNNGGKKGSIPVVILRAPLNVKAFSIEHKIRLTSDLDLSMSQVLSKKGRREIVEEHPTVKMKPDEWYTSRMEVFCPGARHSGDFYEVRCFIDAKLVNHFRNYTDELFVGIGMEQGGVFSANYVVRELVPKHMGELRDGDRWTKGPEEKK